LISVCIAVYNGSQYIEEQVYSILFQLSNTDELIISDDGSNDGTDFIINAIQDERIFYVKNTGVKGYTGNFENALNFAKGDHVFLSDQDDVWHSNKVALMLKSLESHDLVISDARVVNEELKLIHHSYFKLRSTKFSFINSLIRCRYLGCCYAFNRQVLNKAMPFPNNHKLLPHDLWLALISEFFFKVDYLKVPLIDYRRHSENASTGGDKSENSILFKIKFRLYASLNILKVIYER
jgi:glycosyltransferase involved in cell wall biosynthesis